MNKGNAKYIINKYLTIIHKKSNNVEMLNSGYIVGFLNDKKEIQLNKTQKNF